MSTRRSWTLAPLAAAILVGGAAAQEAALDLTPGLWEVTSTTTLGGGMPVIDTAGLTRDQIAQVDAARAVMQPRTDVSKSCVRQAAIESGAFLQLESDEDCERTILRRTRRRLDMNVECSGEPASSGTTSVEALSPTSFQAAIHTTLAQDDLSLPLKVTLTGRWLSADCAALE